MRFQALFYAVLMSGVLTFNIQAKMKIELPQPEDFKELSPVFQGYEDEFQEWQDRAQFNTLSTASAISDSATPLADYTWALRNHLFQTENPKEKFQDIFKSYFKQPSPYPHTPTPFEKLAPQLELFTILGVGAMTTIALLPESFSQWNLKELEERRTLELMWSKIKQGPVKDNDHWAVNYIGHPISGGMYYLLARHSGFTWAESMTFSILMSTFFWEYGLEAVIEVPSILDLIVTPLLGSLFGEAFYHAEKAILKNQNQLLGSKVLGYSARTLMNPAGVIMETLTSEKKPNERGYFKIGYFAEPRRFGVVDPTLLELYYGIRLKVWF